MEVDILRVERQVKKIEGSINTLCGELEQVNHRNHMLSKEIKNLRSQLEAEKKAMDEAHMQAQEPCDRTVLTKVQRNKALKRVIETDQRALDLQKRAEEVEREVTKGSEAVRKKLLAELGNVVVKYNANELKFCNLS